MAATNPYLYLSYTWSDMMFVIILLTHIENERVVVLGLRKNWTKSF